MSQEIQLIANIYFEYSNHKGISGDLIRRLLNDHDHKIFDKMQSGDVEYTYGLGEDGLQYLHLDVYYTSDLNSFKSQLTEAFESVNFSQIAENLANENGLDVSYPEDSLVVADIEVHD